MGLVVYYNNIFDIWGRDIGGESLAGSIYTLGVKIGNISTLFRCRRRREKFFENFLVNFAEIS